MQYFYGMRYSLNEMDELIKKGLAIDGTLGGLILGRSHDDGGIYFWTKEDSFYVLKGEVEGFEYILNFGATKYYSKITDRFHCYDEHKNDFVEYIPPAGIKILDTRTDFEPKFLLFDFDDFSIINKYSTKGYLKTIDTMNRTVTFEIIGDKLAKYVINESV